MAQRITGHTELIGLIANPIRHSKSPMMHNTAFEALGLDYVYLVFEADASNLKDVMTGFRAMQIKGFNVSFPIKQEIIKYLDEVLDAGKMCQAVNTVVNRNGRFIGTNTDGLGWVMAMRDAGIDPTGKKITLLGAGGAATAIAMQCGLEGVREISIFNRQDSFFARAQENAAKLNTMTKTKASVHMLEDLAGLKKEIADSDILVDATSVGFGDQKDVNLIPDASWLRKDLVVSDVVYSPAVTPLLEMAHKAGCSNFNGIGMMLYQGAAAFEMWTGEKMPVDEVKKVIGI